MFVPIHRLDYLDTRESALLWADYRKCQDRRRDTVKEVTEQEEAMSTSAEELCEI